jgi:hypothetical protein
VGRWARLTSVHISRYRTCEFKALQAGWPLPKATPNPLPHALPLLLMESFLLQEDGHVGNLLGWVDAIPFHSSALLQADGFLHEKRAPVNQCGCFRGNFSPLYASPPPPPSPPHSSSQECPFLHRLSPFALSPHFQQPPAHIPLPWHQRHTAGAAGCMEVMQVQPPAPVPQP